MANIVKQIWEGLVSASPYLASIGAITWGTVQWFKFNLVEFINISPWIAPTVYSVVGVSGLLVILKELKVIK